MTDYRTDYRVVGLASIRMGDVPGEDTTTYMVGSESMNTIGKFVPDSAHLIIDPETVNNFFIEESAEIDCQIKTPGIKTIEFATRDMGPVFLAYIFGGSVSGVTVYKAPQTAQVVNEKSFEVITQPINGKKFLIEYPRCSVAVGGDLRFGKSDTGTLTISAVVMQPYSSYAPFKMTLQT